MMKPDKDISIYEFDSDLINKEIQSEIADNKEFIDKYQLNKSDIEFIYNAYLPTIEVGYHSLKIIKQLKRLMERGLIICTYKGNQCPDQLKDIKINPIFE